MGRLVSCWLLPRALSRYIGSEIWVAGWPQTEGMFCLDVRSRLPVWCWWNRGAVSNGAERQQVPETLTSEEYQKAWLVHYLSAKKKCYHIEQETGKMVVLEIWHWWFQIQTANHVCQFVSIHTLSLLFLLLRSSRVHKHFFAAVVLGSKQVIATFEQNRFYQYAINTT